MAGSDNSLDRFKERKGKGPNKLLIAASNDIIMTNLCPLNEVRLTGNNGGILKST